MTIRWLYLFFLLLPGVMGVAAPAAPYASPGYQAVLSGKAPLRVLVISRMAMLAWKGDEEVRVTSVPDKRLLDTGKPTEVTGLARDVDAPGCWLRKNRVNLIPVTTPLRLDSPQPIKIWTPNPDTWQAFPSPLYVTPLADGAFSVARAIMLEDYLRNVVAGEMPDTFHPEALKAQAIIARTYTLCYLGWHADEGADLCATVHCHVYGSRRKPATDAAVKVTRGLVLLDGKGKLAKTYYHSTCGGVTDDAGLLWGPEYAASYLCGVRDLTATNDALPLPINQLLGVKDAYCRGSNSSRWALNFTPAQVDDLVSRNLCKVTGHPDIAISKVTKMAVESRTPNGRALYLRVEGGGASILVKGDKIRWLFGAGIPGPAGLPSTLFTLTVTRNAADQPTGYHFTGAGRGHGIGLCQWGADGRAKASQGCRQILKAYFPGTHLSDEKQ
ncbi:MAG: SpoIID/LytB domain-containing protein [Armatimonadota bacterium]